MIPYLCPQLPQKQKEALSYLVKVPLVYTNVALRIGGRLSPSESTEFLVRGVTIRVSG